MTNEEKQKAFKDIVLARLYTLPSDAILSVGSSGDYNKAQIIKEVTEDSEIGKNIMKIQIKYLQLLKEGIIYGNGNPSNN